MSDYPYPLPHPHSHPHPPPLLPPPLLPPPTPQNRPICFTSKQTSPFYSKMDFLRLNFPLQHHALLHKVLFCERPKSIINFKNEFLPPINFQCTSVNVGRSKGQGGAMDKCPLSVNLFSMSCSVQQKCYQTRMHSSRIHAARSVPYGRSLSRGLYLGGSLPRGTPRRNMGPGSYRK